MDINTTHNVSANNPASGSNNKTKLTDPKPDETHVPIKMETTNPKALSEKRSRAKKKVTHHEMKGTAALSICSEDKGSRDMETLLRPIESANRSAIGRATLSANWELLGLPRSGAYQREKMDAHKA